MRFRRNPFPILLIGVLTSALLMACGPTDGPEVMDSQAVDTGLAREKGATLRFLPLAQDGSLDLEDVDTINFNFVRL